MYEDSSLDTSRSEERRVSKECHSLDTSPYMHTPPKLTNIEDMDREQAEVVEQAFHMDYDVAQAFCSHIVPKAVICFTEEYPDNGMDFEPEGGEGDKNENGEGGDDRGEGGMGLPFPASAKTTGE